MNMMTVGDEPSPKAGMIERRTDDAGVRGGRAATWH